MSGNPIEAIRAHVEKHADKERATFSIAGVKALLDAVAEPTAPAGAAAVKAPFGLDGPQVEMLRSNGLKPEEIAGDPVKQAKRVRELLHWFVRLSRRWANPKWTREHAFELAYYIATTDDRAPLDTYAIKKEAWLNGVKATHVERDQMLRLGFITESEFDAAAPPPQAVVPGKMDSTIYRIEHDGFEGTRQGSYITREGKRGVVLQQVGTKVVHVYGEKWLPDADLALPLPEPGEALSVKDAMVDAALDGAEYIPNADNRKWMRAALESALASQPVPVTVTGAMVDAAAKAMHDGPLGGDDEAEYTSDEWNRPAEWCRDMARAALTAALAPATQAVPVCRVMTMQHSSGAPDHYVSIEVGDRQITPHMFKTKGRAEYEVAEWEWLLNGGEKPSILDFDTDPPGACQFCADTGWVDDQNWTWDYPDLPQERVPGNGKIRCGGCG
ncbi:hypothetical protein [Mesorhizobium sp.]|uniref:hypothetical protein n=1 Tax=Mesorhizobium sp. TaxID=1871066 RepID=UPI000FE847B4|nr:hypothetical protein [Mesorhizobium sp.]RWO23304.1 MAG: hypothetical protein EOS09_16895 [Mesorhizobium sp.]